MLKNMSVLDAIGNTPIVLLNNINPNPRVRLYAKLEGSNPGGSVKDRIALNMVKDAEEKGLLTKNKIIFEPTSGNTGIGLAMVAAAKGYKVKLVMPECVSLERRRTLEAFGAELILSPGKEGTDGAIRMAHKIYEENKDIYFMPDQFNNAANWRAHYETTGIEVYEQTNREISVFIGGIGTSGTVMGTSRRLKEYDKSIQIVAAEPHLGHKIQGLKNMAESIVPGIFDPSRIDEKHNVDDEVAYDTARELAYKEGLFVGMSSGCAMRVAINKAKELQDGVIVVVLPDRGDRYLSTALFKSVCAACPP
ncbi:MAG: cysteine synthase family protein [Candidatus Magnetoovum sp. WYHC-5]|nr:cysteine synthase family protein [Candidatus Magnetoovum sp. WYHC-5]